MRVLQNNKGIALSIVIMVTTLLLVLVSGIIALATQEKQLAGSEEDMTKALYLADAGIELAIDKLNKDSTWTGSGGYISLGPDLRGFVKVDVTSFGNTWKITSNGQYRDESGKILSSRTYLADLLKSVEYLTPNDYKGKIPDLSQLDNNIKGTFNITPYQEKDAGKYYYTGNLEIFGKYEGSWLIVVEGNVTITNNLEPQPNKNGVLVIIASGNVTLSGQGNSSKTARAVIICPHYVGTPNSVLTGKIISDNIELQEGDEGNVQNNGNGNGKGNGNGNSNDKAIYIEDNDYYDTAVLHLGLGKITLVNWQELYRVF